MAIALAQYQAWDDAISADDTSLLDDTTAWDETAGGENVLNYIMNTTSSTKSYERTATFLSGPIALPPVRMNSAKIEWTEDKPAGTSVTCSIALSKDGGKTWQLWRNVTNGGAIPGLSQKENLAGYMLQVRFDLATTDYAVRPSVSQFVVTINSMKIIRFMPDGLVKIDKTLVQNASEVF